MPDPKKDLAKSVEAQRKMREAAAEEKRKLEEERKRRERQSKG